VLSWNIWSENKNIDEIISFIKREDADFICLQEAALEVLEELEKLSCYSIIHAHDFFYEKSGINIPTFLVVLSKFRVVGHERIALKKGRERPLWARLFGWDESREYQYVDCRTPAGDLRIINAHLESCASPRRRRRQFRNVLRSVNPLKLTIVCGDFNVWGKWYFNIFAGLFVDYNWQDWEEWHMSEQTKFHSLVERFGFHNACGPCITYPQFVQTVDQIDYILVPSNSKERIISTTVFEDTVGSDHRPLIAEIEIPESFKK